MKYSCSEDDEGTFIVTRRTNMVQEGPVVGNLSIARGAFVGNLSKKWSLPDVELYNSM
jgi:hypothetical protein